MAVETIKQMSLMEKLRWRAFDRADARRIRAGFHEQWKEEGLAEGRAEGREEGIAQANRGKYAWPVVRAGGISCLLTPV